MSDPSPPSRLSKDTPEVRSLTRRQRDIAVIGWASFLAAAVASMVLFAFVDPGALSDVTEPPFGVSRMTGYAIGFFFLWMLAAGSAALTVYLIRTRRGHSPQP